jgi:hypothetical protein
MNIVTVNDGGLWNNPEQAQLVSVNFGGKDPLTPPPRAEIERGITELRGRGFPDSDIYAAMSRAVGESLAAELLPQDAD